MEKRLKMTLCGKHLKIVSLFNRIKQLPNQLNTKDLAGTKFSMGELQRLEIAKTLMTQPLFLFLDEATNNIDIPTEKKIIQNIKFEYPDLALIMITHRINIDQLKHRKYLLQNGKLIPMYNSKYLVKQKTSVETSRTVFHSEGKDIYSS